MALSEATTFDNHGNLVIIEEHLLHTLGELEEKVHEIEDPAEYISTKITRSFRGSVLPSILMAMKKRPTLHVFVLAAQYPQKDKKLQPLLVKLVDEYNKQLKDAIDKITALGYCEGEQGFYVLANFRDIESLAFEFREGSVTFIEVSGALP